MTDERNHDSWPRDVAAALETLPAQQRSALRLLYFERRPEPEVAVHLGIAVSHLRTAVARGLGDLGRALVGHEVVPSRRDS